MALLAAFEEGADRILAAASVKPQESVIMPSKIGTRRGDVIEEVCSLRADRPSRSAIAIVSGQRHLFVRGHGGAPYGNRTRVSAVKDR